MLTYNHYVTITFIVIAILLISWVYLSYRDSHDDNHNEKGWGNVLAFLAYISQELKKNKSQSHEKDCKEVEKETKGRGKFESKGEKICRETLEKIFKKPFPNVRPKWLKNPETGKCIELDCYNEDLQIAVEYNGIQHYQWPNFTGQTREKFDAQLRRDNYKKKACKERNIHLIIVPYTVKHKNIYQYIYQRLPMI